MTSGTRRATGPAPALHRLAWRWHFLAGLFVLPFILVLATSGAIYLFKPQIDRWEERRWIGLDPHGAVSPDRQRDAALAAAPGARFDGYRLPRASGDAAMIAVTLPDGGAREIYVSPQGRVLGQLDPERRIAATVARLHGSLLIGPVGDRLVELAASWTIVLILTGLYLWWPRPWRLAGTLWPRWSLRRRALLKDLHRVLGFWIAGLVLVTLASGLPWAGAWGSAFQWVRGELGLVAGPPPWKVGAEARHAGHDHGAMSPPAPPHPDVRALPLAAFVARAEREHMAFPVLVLPPSATPASGRPAGAAWTVLSRAQNRPLDRQVSYDAQTGAEIARRGFGDQHVIDRIVSTGIAWHEGQLFGWINQLIGLSTAIALVALSAIGGLMWWRRRPEGRLGAPPPPDAPLPRGAMATIVMLGLALPLFGTSVLVLAGIGYARRCAVRLVA